MHYFYCDNSIEYVCVLNMCVLYVCVCVHVCVYMCVYSMCVCVCLCVCMCTCVCVCVCVCMCVCIEYSMCVHVRFRTSPSPPIIGQLSNIIIMCVLNMCVCVY